MTGLQARAPRKCIELPKQFPPVAVEAVTIHDDAALVRVKRPDGGLEDVTIDLEKLEQALERASSATASLVSSIDMRHALEAVRIRLAYAFNPHFAVSHSGVRALVGVLRIGGTDGAQCLYRLAVVAGGEIALAVGSVGT